MDSVNRIYITHVHHLPRVLQMCCAKERAKPRLDPRTGDTKADVLSVGLRTLPRSGISNACPYDAINRLGSNGDR